MPNKLFGRVARLLVFPIGQPAILIGGDLRIEFTCKKSPSSDPNTAELKITNLSKNTRDRLDEQVDTPLVFSAGYEQGDGLINVFFGDIMSVRHNETAPDIVTIIEVGDGAVALRDSRVSFSFSKNTSVSTVIQQLAIGLGKPIRNPQAISSQTGVFLSGYTAIGNNRTLLDQLARESGFSWSVQDDEIVIVSDTDAPPVDILVLSPETGLVGIPERNTSSVDPQSGGIAIAGGNSKPPGWNVTAKLFPDIVPGGFFVLKFKERPIGEIVKVIDVEHSGDTYGDMWTTKIQVQDI
jgi:hypothetical protein